MITVNKSPDRKSNKLWVLKIAIGLGCLWKSTALQEGEVATFVQVKILQFRALGIVYILSYSLATEKGLCRR